ncbi:MAG: BON domain-containing protein [Tatlockia sp.]|jgi:osmotically-inducible protein OsmY
MEELVHRMKRQGGMLFAVLVSSALLSGCYGSLWTGATILYDRHTVYKKVNDYQLGANANHALYDDWMFKRKDCTIELAVLNGDILLLGHVANAALRHEAQARIARLNGIRRLINQITINENSGHNTVVDSWITTKIRSRIFADAEIDPKAFKIITFNKIVYLMGDVRPKEALRVIEIARTTQGVIRVVKLLKYYNLSHQAALVEDE